MKKHFIGFLILIAAITSLNGKATSWETDYERAFERALLEDKPLLLFFTGSDWCVWCHKLDLEVFGVAVFADGIDRFAVPVLLDFPQRRRLPPAQAKINRVLRDRWKVEAFPTVLLVDSQTGSLLWRHSYLAIEASAYLEAIEKASEAFKNSRREYRSR